MNTTLRNTIKTIDNYLFAGSIKKLNRCRWRYQSSWLRYLHTQKMQAKFTSNNNICLTKKQQNYLGSLFDKHGSDKGYYLHNKDDMSGHNYNDIYELLFFQHKQKTKLVLECGIGSKNTAITSNMSLYKRSTPGGSLHAWRDYFPNAQIIGIDIDPDVMFTEDRINTYVANQTSKKSINNFINQANLQPNTVDIIIDDGLHEFNANITLFENTKHLLKDNGIYIIEDFDVTSKEQKLFIDYFKNIDNYNVIFIKISIAHLIVITKKDV
jgi:SAM-dependent methyltransferase